MMMEHLTPEQIDACCSGEMWAGIAEHLEECEGCRARLLEERLLRAVLFRAASGERKLPGAHPTDESLAALFETVLPATTAAGLQDHIQQCDHCLDELLWLKQASGKLRDGEIGPTRHLPQEAPPPAFSDRVRKQFVEGGKSGMPTAAGRGHKASTMAQPRPLGQLTVVATGPLGWKLEWRPAAIQHLGFMASGATVASYATPASVSLSLLPSPPAPAETSWMAAKSMEMRDMIPPEFAPAPKRKRAAPSAYATPMSESSGPGAAPKTARASAAPSNPVPAPAPPSIPPRQEATQEGAPQGSLAETIPETHESVEVTAGSALFILETVATPEGLYLRVSALDSISRSPAPQVAIRMVSPAGEDPLIHSDEGGMASLPLPPGHTRLLFHTDEEWELLLFYDGPELAEDAP